MKSKVRVALADDHPIVLAGLRNLIETEPDLDLVGDATTGQAALELIESTVPDVAILDISMPEISGIALARRLAEERSSVRIIILTFYEERSFLKQALAAGVKGYVLKHSAAENLVSSIRAVQSGQVYIDPSLGQEPTEPAGTQPSRTHRTSTLRLTEREASVLRYSARGLTIKEIAGRLELSSKTVETYKSRAIEKLDLKTRAEIVRFASTQGWLEDI